MLSFAGSVRVFLAVEPADMRKGFEGLHALASERLREDVRSGALFVFTNKRRTRLKMLYFDGTGLWLMTNTHAPHCTEWMCLASPLSVSPAFRPGDPGIWRCRRTERYDVRPASE